jgi:aminoglycoside 2'-N-acetyltransferase I
VSEVVVRHTADLDDRTREACRALLYDVFDDMTEADWEHALGGLHAVALEAGELVGHASLVQRRLVHRGRALRAGYVEAVAVRADRRRRGVGASLMAPLERAALRAYDVAALGSTDEGAPFYLSRGWVLWRGPTSALTPDGVRPTPDADGAVHVLLGAEELDLDGELTCDWRDGDVW